jgi:choline dehydrogenase-like flavoprotein
MITDARSIPANAELKCDLCIVGAGAAGITLALQFVESKLRVIVLESGGEKLEAEQQALYHGEVVDGVHSPAHLYRQRRLGGSTTIWGGRCVPLDEQDFWKRPHVPLSGWPFDRSALQPFYERAQTLLETGVFDYSAATALRGATLVEAFRDPDMLAEGLERFSPPTNFWKRYRAELAKSAAVIVVKHATCLRLSGGEAVTGLECAGRGDMRFRVHARPNWGNCAFCQRIEASNSASNERMIESIAADASPCGPKSRMRWESSTPRSACITRTSSIPHIVIPCSPRCI